MAPRAPIDKRSPAEFKKILFAAGFYTALSGALNGVALSELATPVGYTSGACVNAGRFLSNGDMTGWWKMVLISLNFYMGGIIAGVGGSSFDDMVEGKVSYGMILSSFILVLGSIAKRNFSRPILACQLLALSQGLTNAITRKFSAAPISATHTAGGMTDAAMTIGNAIKAGQFSAGPGYRKAILNMVCNFGMMLGGFLSIGGYKRYGALVWYQCAAGLAASAVVMPMILPCPEEKAEDAKTA